MFSLHEGEGLGMRAKRISAGKDTLPNRLIAAINMGLTPGGSVQAQRLFRQRRQRFRPAQI